MKKNIVFNTFLLVVLLLAGGCKKQFEDYAANPNVPTSVPAYLLLRQIENDIMVFPGGDEDKFGQYTLSTYTYYGTNEYWSGPATLNYGILRNVIAMEKESTIGSSASNPYTALAKFFKAYIFVGMSLKVGDLPMTEALKGLEIPTPKYNTQKEIFVQSLQWLEEANTDLAELISKSDVSILGDFYYQERLSNAKDPLNTLRQWQRAVNTYKLRVLINLSKKEGDADLNIKQKFSEVISNPAKYPIMENMSDNLQYVYNDAYNNYPNNKNNFGIDATRLCVAATWLNTLSGLNDLRAMRVAEPARGLGFSDISYKSFVGGLNGDDLSTLGGQSASYSISLIGRKRYYNGLTGENTFLVGYPEMCLNIAEAINRGWIIGDAASWYRKGIEAMFTFYDIKDGVNTVEFLRGSAPGDYISYNVTFNYNDYFAQPAVNYAGNNAAGLNQILTQRYLALARNSGLEGYYQWRRTGVPVFSVGAGTGNSNVIPLRYLYPTDEQNTNTANYNEAVQRQYGGDDNINLKMWIIQ